MRLFCAQTEDRKVGGGGRTQMRLFCAQTEDRKVGGGGGQQRGRRYNRLLRLSQWH